MPCFTPHFHGQRKNVAPRDRCLIRDGDLQTFYQNEVLQNHSEKKKNHTWIVLCQRRFIVYSPCGRVNKGRDCVEKDGVHVMSSAETVLKNKAESLL